MPQVPTAGSLPKYFWALFAVYSVASLTHFVHNAEFIAFYPNMPSWITRETVYLAWLGIGCLGLSGLLMWRFKLFALGMLCMGAYGALGIDGLAHYSLALCGEHTLATNFTIWFEVITGFVLLIASGLWLGRWIAPALKRIGF
jgi:H+/Cl- antiporter ClcA